MLQRRVPPRETAQELLYREFLRVNKIPLRQLIID